MFEEPGTPEAGEPVDELDSLLEGARPLPSPAFRGALARLIAVTPLPRLVRHWRPKAVSLTVAGILLLGLAATGVAGEGPLAPSHAAASAVSTSH